VGAIAFKDGATLLAQQALDDSGSASFVTTSLASGAHSLSAVYTGDAAHVGGASTVLAQMIDPAACIFGLSTTQEVYGTAGGTGVVNVTAGSACSWGASSPAGWVTLSGAATASGNGAVHFTVAANTGSARSTTLTIAGLHFSIRQRAAAREVRRPLRIP
jgi:hypothetical protein